MAAFIALVTPFALNAIVGAAKYFNMATTTPGKRLVLGILALLGVLAGNALTGTPVQLDSISSDFSIIVESFLAFIAAHGSYNLFWNQVK